jgi:hypothetical protein
MSNLLLTMKENPITDEAKASGRQPGKRFRILAAGLIS